MRKKIIAGNWKMNKTLQEGVALTSEVVNMVKDEVMADVEVILIPPFIHLSNVGGLVNGKVSAGAQNCHAETSGAFTGEISAAMIKSVGCKWCLVGHSERRQYNAETNQILARKVDALLSQSITAIYCCGETLDQRNAGEHFDVIASQIKEGLFHLNETQMNSVVVAYEPVWAIGTGVTASTEQAQEVHAFIRGLFRKKYNDSVAGDIRILYGGSVKPDNARELFSQTDIDGGLVGGASLQSRSFTDIVKGA